MPKLNQIIAIANGKKSHASSELTKLYHLLQKPALLDGISRTYQPKDEEGERLPPEKKNPQLSVSSAIQTATAALTELFDVVATQDYANTAAKADLVVDGKTILGGVPVTHLLFLEKQLVDLGTFVDKLPSLDLRETWTPAAADCYRSETSGTTRTKKLPRNHVKYEATKEHPAQVDVYTEDVIVGTWSTTKFSGAIPASEKNAMLSRVRKLQEAVKAAREEANNTEAPQRHTAKSILDFVFQTSVA